MKQKAETVKQDDEFYNKMCKGSEGWEGGGSGMKISLNKVSESGLK